MPNSQPPPAGGAPGMVATDTNSLSAKHTTRAQKAAITTCLEVKENFALISGSAAVGKLVISGAKLKKDDAFKKRTARINLTSESKWEWGSTKQRYHTTIPCSPSTKTRIQNSGLAVCAVILRKRRGVLF